MFGVSSASFATLHTMPTNSRPCSSACGPRTDSISLESSLSCRAPTRNLKASSAAVATDGAGNSPAGRDFAARHADLNFALGPDLPTLAATCADIKRRARDRYGRALSVFTMGYVVCRETEREALRYRDYYVKEKGDFAAAHNLLETLIPNSQSALGDQYKAMIENFIAGYSALPLVGTPDQVVDGMIEMARAGFDGLTLSWVDYDEGIAQYRDQLRHCSSRPCASSSATFACAGPFSSILPRRLKHIAAMPCALTINAAALRIDLNKAAEAQRRS